MKPIDFQPIDTGTKIDFQPMNQIYPDNSPSQPQAQPDSASNLWGSAPELRTALQSDHPVWNSLQVPSQMAERGLQPLTSGVLGALPILAPTGNTTLDVLKNTPRIAAETLATAAPAMINRTSILTAGAADALGAVAPAAGAVGRGLARQLESISGAEPGSVSAAFKDPSLIFAKGKAAASPLYEAGKAGMGDQASLFEGMIHPQQVVDTAQAYLAKGGTLEPAEALTYRKALDVLGRSRNVMKDALIPMRQEADAMAKASPDIAAGDAAHQRGRMADSLRNLMPQNKYGGASAFKMGIMAALEQMGIPGKAVLAALSPAAAGVAATGAGIASRAVSPVATNPGLAVALQDLYKQYVERKNGKQSDLTGSALDALSSLE